MFRIYATILVLTLGAGVAQAEPTSLGVTWNINAGGDGSCTRAEDNFDSAGFGAKFTTVTYAKNGQYVVVSDDTGITDRGWFCIKTKSKEDLDALDSPPSNPFTVEVDVEMTNDDYEEAEGTIKFKVIR